MYDSIRLHGYLGYSFRRGRALGLFLLGAWFSSWYVVSIDTGHIAQSPHLPHQAWLKALGYLCSSIRSLDTTQKNYPTLWIKATMMLKEETEQALS